MSELAVNEVRSSTLHGHKDKGPLNYWLPNLKWKVLQII